jgi:hypothetical protein
MYVINLIILLNILGVLIDNKRFVLFVSNDERQNSFLCV